MKYSLELCDAMVHYYEAKARVLVHKARLFRRWRISKCYLNAATWRKRAIRLEDSDGQG